MKSIRRVMIEDFQSHRHTDLELVDGFNVIVGPSDQGKTAVLRAIRWVLFNEPRGSDFVRVGAAKAKVTLIMNDGTMVIRERSSSRNRYIVAVPEAEEQVYEGFGHTVPEEVMIATGVRRMQLDEDYEVAIHLGMQLDSPFLLDNNGAIKAKAIGRMNGVHILDYAHKMTNSELGSKQVEDRRIEAELEKIEDQLEQYADLDDWEKRLEQIDHLNSVLSQGEERVLVLSKLKDQHVDLTKKLVIAKNYLANLSGLDQASELFGQSRELAERLERLQSLKTRLEETKKELHVAEEYINHTTGLAAAQNKLNQLEEMWKLEQQASKANTHRHAIQVESAKVDLVLMKTAGVAQAEQIHVRLQETQKREEQITGQRMKREEQITLKKKLATVLSKTAGLEKAQQLWERSSTEDQRVDQLNELANRMKEQKDLLNKADAFLRKINGLPIAETKISDLESKIFLQEQLKSLSQKYASNDEEKQMMMTEYSKVNQKLQTLAEEYSEQLKELGRCPICLGEIETHTIDRIIKEIK